MNPTPTESENSLPGKNLPEAPDGPFFCESCRRRYSVSALDCPHCEEEPLLDLRDPRVEELIRSFDLRDWRKRAAVFTMATAVLFLPILLIEALVPYLGLAIYGFSVAGLSGFLSRRYPPIPRLPAEPDELAGE